MVTSLLRAPFDVELRRARVGRVMPAPPAVPVTAPIRDVAGVSFYVDDSKSVVDPDLRAQNLAALAPLRRFVADVVALSDGWMVSRPADPRYAQRAGEALAAWAGAGALLGQVNQQGAYEREWTLGSLALAYLKIHDAAAVPAPQHAAIQRWLCAIAGAVRPHYERMDRKSSSNNHAYWTGMAVAAAGVACQDRDHFAWGLARARIGLAQVSADGLLPLEVARERLALHYHVFALAPLVMLAELAVANGVPLYDERDHALRRLAERVIAGLADPRGFEQLTGFAQEQLTFPPQKADLAWAEPYGARFPDARVAAWLDGARPVRDVRLGGDLTAAFR
jgi:poly(beta-D-mannuronate) lyase